MVVRSFKHTENVTYLLVQVQFLLALFGGQMARVLFFGSTLSKLIKENYLSRLRSFANLQDSQDLQNSFIITLLHDVEHTLVIRSSLLVR